MHIVGQAPSEVMIFLLLLSLILTTEPDIPEQVHAMQIGSMPGTVELSSAVSISPSHAVALCMFYPGTPVILDLDTGMIYPDSIVFSPDLGIVLLIFSEEVFQEYQIPSDHLPEIGETLQIIGQELNGTVTVEGTIMEQYPDGAVLLASELRDGLMGAAAFDDNGMFVGIITGTIQPEFQFPENTDQDYLVLYPSQIWYMWAQLAIQSEEYSGKPFGVTALSSISLSQNRSSGIQLVSVTENSTAWNVGLRPGDLITHINNIPVYHPETLRGLLILSEDTLEARVLTRNQERFILILPCNQ